MKTAILLLLSLVPLTTFAGEAYTFECTIHTIDGGGRLSKLVFSEDGAALAGEFLEANQVGAFDHKSIVNSVNTYVNSAEGKNLRLSIKSAQATKSFNGYPENGSTLVIAGVLAVEVEASLNLDEVVNYQGVCVERYQRD